MAGSPDGPESLSAPSPKKVNDLRLIVVLSGNDDVQFFNKILRRDDIVFTYGAKLRLLGQVAGPKRMICRGSVADLEKAINDLGDLSVDFILYNPKQWAESHAPKDEIADLLAAVKKARTLADRHRAKLGFVTDRILLDRYGDGLPRW